MIPYRFTTFIILTIVLIAGCKEESSKIEHPIYQQAVVNRITLPNGWALTPMGDSLPLGDLPMNLIFSSSKKYAAITNNGQSTHSVMLLDVASQKILDDVEIYSGWYGLDFNQDETALYVSGGNRNLIWKFDIADNRLVKSDSIVLSVPWPEDTVSVAGICLDEQRNRIYAVTKENNSLYEVDLDSKEILRQIILPGKAFSCILTPDYSTLYISIWGNQEVLAYNLDNEDIVAHIKVGSHPNDMALTEDGQFLFVACANDNTVSVINTVENKMIESFSTALYPDSLAGSTTNSVALSDNDEYLYIANADNNCLAVFEVEEPGESKSLGFIPTGWYPTVVESIGDKLWIVNGKGFTSLANPEGPNPYLPRTDETQYIGSMFKGSLSVMDIPSADTLEIYSQLVYDNTPYDKEKINNIGEYENNPIPTEVGDPSPIKYVFYVVKENRTYDQVFGDMPEGNGDPDICLFPDSVTPNHHALVRDFVLLDNFYVNAEVSADGHNWSMGAYANDYIEKTWPTLYGGRGGTYDYEGGVEIAYPDAGFMWNACQEAGISYRTYGLFANYDRTLLPVLEGHASAVYPGYDLGIKDSFRVEQWKMEFDSLVDAGAVPRFNTIRFGNDHTAGARIGFPTPSAMVADNDLAVGKLVEYISHSPIWEESAIFILQDDAQNGPDHVDAHRSVGMVISPYTKRNAVISEMYSTCSMLRTMQLILGIPPLSQYDATAVPMHACFTNEIDTTPYTHIPATYDLNEMNTERNELSDLSETFNLDTYDAAPDVPFGRVVWKTVRGMDSEMPAPRRSAFVRVVFEEEEEGER